MKGPGWGSWPGLLVLALVLVALRLHFFDWPPNRDVTEYAVTAHELLGGRDLYSDVWNPKPPAVFVSYAIAELCFGYGPGQLFALNLVCGLVLLVGVWAAGSASGHGQVAGLWAAGFWTVVSGNLDLQLDSANTEAFMNACLIWAFVALVATRDEPLSNGRALAVGVVLGWASLYKHVVVTIAIALAIGYVAVPPRGTNRRRAVGQAALLALGGAVCWVATTAYMAATGRLGVLYDTLVTHGLAYAGSVSGNVAAALFKSEVVREAQHFPAPIALGLFGLAGAAAGLCGKHRRSWLLLGLYGAGAWLAVALPGKNYRHYYQLLLPPAIVAAGWATASIASALGNGRFKRVPQFAAALILLYLGAHEARTYLATPEERLDRVYADRYLAAQELGRRLGSELRPEETFFQFGYETGLYFYSRRPTSVVLGWTLWREPFAKPLTARTLADLERAPPDVVIVDRSLRERHADHAVLRWIDENYPLRGELSERPARYFSLLLRPDSPAAQRFGATPPDR